MHLMLVLIMSLSFVMTAILTKPNMWELLKGLLVPSVPKNGILTIIALVGTTVVPYNLFLHAALVSEKWKSKDDLNLAIRNVPLADSINQIGLNVYDVLKKDHILFTEQGLKEFEDRLSK